jgi:hypothetical protein
MSTSHGALKKRGGQLRRPCRQRICPNPGLENRVNAPGRRGVFCHEALLISDTAIPKACAHGLVGEAYQRMAGFAGLEAADLILGKIVEFQKTNSVV